MGNALRTMLGGSGRSMARKLGESEEPLKAQLQLRMKDKAQEAILRAASVPETEDVDGLQNIKGASQESINQLVRAIQSRPVNFVELSPRHVAEQQVIPPRRKDMTKEEIETMYSGRLSGPSLRALFEDELACRRSGKEADLSSLATTYGVDGDILNRVFEYCYMPSVVQASDGRLEVATR